MGLSNRPEQKQTRRHFVGALGSLFASCVAACGHRDTGSQLQRETLPSWEGAVDWNNYSIKVSEAVLARIQNAYNHEKEVAFLLLADTSGTIVQATDVGVISASRSSVGYLPGIIEAINQRAAAEGLKVVGTYHSHINDEQKGGGLRLSHDDIFWIGDTPDNIIRLVGWGATPQDHQFLACFSIGTPTGPRDLIPLGPNNRFVKPDIYRALEKAGVLASSERRRNDLVKLTIISLAAAIPPTPMQLETDIRAIQDNLSAKFQEARARLRHEYLRRVQLD